MKNNKTFSLEEILDSFDVSIGLEVHVTLKTTTKLFSSTKVVDFFAKPNTAVSFWELGYPGVKPLLNKKAVSFAIQAAYLLNMKIDYLLRFDRKNYFYPDLPKGYQLTQYYHPIGKDGYLNIFSENKLKKIKIKHLHIEEDSAKMLHLDDKTLIDFNRAGNPLIEIVTDYQDLKSGDDVQVFLTTLHNLLVEHEITKGRLEGGEFRFDVNISLRQKNSLVMGQKVEIKNVSSFNFAKKATINEIITIGNKLLNNLEVLPETKGFNPKTFQNFRMRVKSSLSDYRYMPDCNIIPIKLDNNWVKEQINLLKPKINYSEKLNMIVNRWGFLLKDVHLIATTNNNLLFNFLKNLSQEERQPYFVFYSNLFLAYSKNQSQYYQYLKEINNFSYFLFNQRKSLDFNLIEKCVNLFFKSFPDSLNLNPEDLVLKLQSETKKASIKPEEISAYIEVSFKAFPDMIRSYQELENRPKVINFFMRRLVPLLIKKVGNPKIIKDLLTQKLNESLSSK